MSIEEQHTVMTGEGRALLTESERKVLADEADATTNYEYKVRSLVRNRVRKQLGQDIEILEEHFPEVYEMVHQEVCEDDSRE